MYPFILLSIVHLYACCRRKRRLRIITKPLLLPVLALWYLHFAPSPETLVLIALFFGWVGDTLLLPIGTPKTKAAGGAAFFIGHALYLAHMLSVIAFPPLWLIISMLVCFGASAALSFHDLGPYLSKTLRPLAFSYMVMLYCMVMAALVFAHDGLGVAPMIGAFLFLISDTLLIKEMLIKKTRYGNFFVMLLYLAAQFLLVLGFALAS